MTRVQPAEVNAGTMSIVCDVALLNIVFGASVVGAVSYSWTENDAGGAVEYTVPLYLNLSQIAPATSVNTHFRVRIRPNFFWGNGTYGPAWVITIAGSVVVMVLQQKEPEVELRNEDTENMLVYPNPGRGDRFMLVIENAKSDAYELRITDQLGRTIESSSNVNLKSSPISEMMLNQKLTNGINFIHVISDQGHQLLP